MNVDLSRGVDSRVATSSYLSCTYVQQHTVQNHLKLCNNMPCAYGMSDRERWYYGTENAHASHVSVCCLRFIQSWLSKFFSGFDAALATPATRRPRAPAASISHRFSYYNPRQTIKLRQQNLFTWFSFPRYACKIFCQLLFHSYFSLFPVNLVQRFVFFINITLRKNSQNVGKKISKINN